MSKQNAKAKISNLPAGGFVALGRDNASDTSARLKSQSVSKKEIKVS